MKAVFLDRDGTITVGIPKYERVDSIDKVELLPNVLEGLKVLASMDFVFFFVTNQAGIAEGRLTMEEFWRINQQVLKLIVPSGLKVIETFVCPHAENSDCECRKPKPKMLQDAAKKYGVDLANSYVVGDRQTDVITGINAGTKIILVKSGAEIPGQEAIEVNFVAKDMLEAARYIAGHG